MSNAVYVDDDILEIRRDNGSEWEVYWGDPLLRIASEDRNGRLRVATRDREGNMVLGWIRNTARLAAESKVLRFSMIDVQQGDGMILETPSGKVMFIDGGDNKLFARHAAARYAGTSKDRRQIVDAILITHGDADHFKGLSEIRKSESDGRPGKALHIAPLRILHNGMVKRPTAGRKDVEMFGKTVDVNGVPFVTELVDDPRTVSPAERNGPFNEWCDTLDHWDSVTKAETQKAMMVARVDHLSDAGTLFDFLADENIGVEILGPIVEDAGGQAGLRFLRKPAADAWLETGDTGTPAKGPYSASHTINGHSINLRITYGNIRFLLTGDMNKESMDRTRSALNAAGRAADLECEILKAPHHGSADFDMAFLRAANPIVSLVSSGDESVAKEHIHPRATLMAALGKASRDPGPAIIFSTELAAFFAYRGWSVDQEVTAKQEAAYEGFERLNFGIIHIRTDGKRVLTFTHSGKRGMNEAYAFTVADDGTVKFDKAVSETGAPQPD